MTQSGDILSDDPAMHDEALNLKSFARRGVHSLPFPAPFCSTCQSNQRLIVSLLSSYLPPSDDDPDYEPRLASFAAYKASMHARYPPLDRYKLNRELRWWTARGALWVATLVGVVSVDVAGATGRLILPGTSILVPSLTALVLLSILWTAWLPTYASFRRAELQGRKVRVRGRERYAVSLICLDVRHNLPPSLHRHYRSRRVPHCLSSTVSASTSSSFSHPSEPHDSLSVPHRPWHAAGPPVFGHTSLLRPAIFSPAPTRDDAEMRSQQQQQDEEEDDAMDWTPTASPVRLSSSSGPVPRDAGHVRTSGAPADATTGLETLLERTNIDSSEPGGGASYAARAGQRGAQTSWSWGWVYALSLVPLVLLGRGFFRALIRPTW
ncbi:hypothetical protein EDB83DRAFT_2337059, partial [Lactarius deliciosus]